MTDTNQSEDVDGKGTQQQEQESPPKPISILDELVGEGKKFKTVEDLAKGKKEADRFIEDLKAQINSLQADLSKQEVLETLVEKVNKVMTNADPTVTTKAEPPVAPVTPVTPASPTPTNETDIEAKVAAAIAKMRADDLVASNRVAVMSTLVNRFGSEDKVKEHIAFKAGELGVSPEFLSSVGDKSPNALFSMLGVVPNSGSSSGPRSTSFSSTGSQNTSASASAKSSQVIEAEKTLAEIATIRKTKPSLYFTDDIQKKMFNARKILLENS